MPFLDSEAEVEQDGVAGSERLRAITAAFQQELSAAVNNNTHLPRKPDQVDGLRRSLQALETACSVLIPGRRAVTLSGPFSQHVVTQLEEAINPNTGSDPDLNFKQPEQVAKCLAEQRVSVVDCVLYAFQMEKIGRDLRERRYLDRMMELARRPPLSPSFVPRRLMGGKVRVALR
jgi:hypothetical protein